MELTTHEAIKQHLFKLLNDEYCIYGEYHRNLRRIIYIKNLEISIEFDEYNKTIDLKLDDKLLLSFIGLESYNQIYEETISALRRYRDEKINREKKEHEELVQKFLNL